MRDIPIADLYDKRTGKMKLWYRISSVVKLLLLCFIFAIATLFLSAVLDLNITEAFIFLFAIVMATMFFGAFHIKMSQNGHRHKRYKPDTLTDQEVRERMERRKRNGTDEDWKDASGT